MWRQLMKATEGISLCRKLQKDIRRCTIVGASAQKQTRKKGVQCKYGCNGLLVVLHSAAWFFLVQISGGCGWVWVGLLGCATGWDWCEGVCLCYVQGWACSSSTQNCVEATWNNLELAIFTRRRISLCLSRAIGSLIKIML